MINSLSIEKKTILSSTQLLNLYIASGGEKATYEEVIREYKREKRSEKIKELKIKHKWLFPLFFIVYITTQISEDFD